MRTPLADALRHAATAGLLRARVRKIPAGRLADALLRLAAQESEASRLSLTLAMKRPRLRD